MELKKLQKIVVGALEDVKAQDIKLFDTSELTAMFDCVAIASGNSSRQTKALAAAVRDKVREAGGQVISIEGENTGEWVLVDLGDMVVHIMHPTIRDYYQLEGIWGGKPIKLPVKKAATKTTAAKTKTTKTTGEKKATKRTSKPKTETAAKKTTVKKSVTATKRTTRKTKDMDE